jgi:two-component system copper resistance phosphate regulon response regulator CusR
MQSNLTRILLVEDEVKVANTIKAGLEENEYEVFVAYDGNAGKRLFLNKNFEMVILDINLPQINGYELCKIIREKDSKVPVLMLTALSTTDDKLSGFESGADDYLVKPFEFRELLARIKVLLKRSNLLNAEKKLKVLDLEMDLESKEVKRAGKLISLTAKEFSLLEYFIRNTGKVISKTEISNKIWDIHFDTGTNVIEVYVNFLRKKIDKDFDVKLLHTRTGMGYVLKAD